MTSNYNPGDKVWVKAEVLPARSASTLVFLQVTDAVGPVGHLMHPRDIRRRVKRKAPNSAWQPIDTAPSNVPVLVFGYRHGRPVVHIAQKQPDVDVDGAERTAWTGCRFEPTHWMPLPEPPQ